MAEGVGTNVEGKEGDGLVPFVKLVPLFDGELTQYTRAEPSLFVPSLCSTKMVPNVVRRSRAKVALRFAACAWTRRKESEPRTNRLASEGATVARSATRKGILIRMIEVCGVRGEGRIRSLRERLKDLGAAEVEIQGKMVKRMADPGGERPKRRPIRPE